MNDDENENNDIIDQKWQDIKNITEVVKKCIGRKTKTSRKRWYNKKCEGIKNPERSE